jgi:hypothetical protein
LTLFLIDCINALWNNNHPIWNHHRSCLHLPLCSYYRVSHVSGIYIPTSRHRWPMILSIVPLPSSPYCFIHVASGYRIITLNQFHVDFKFSISQFTYLCRPRHSFTTWWCIGIVITGLCFFFIYYPLCMYHRIESSIHSCHHASNHP